MNCAQFKLKEIPKPPPFELESVILCNKIEMKDNWAYPKEEKKVFIKGEDKNIISFVSFKHMKGQHLLQWKWYNPKKEIYRETEEIKIGEGNKYFEKYIAWDRIFLFEEKENGIWTTAIFLDGKLLETVEFEIK